MKKSNEYTLKDAIDSMIKSYGLKDKLDETKVISKWEKLIGPSMSKHISRIYIKDRKLYLYVDSGPLKNELLYSKSKIIETLNNEIGEEVIEEVVVR